MRPIDADAAKKDFGEHFGDVQDAVCAQQIIDRQPTIDRDSLIPHGQWIEKPYLIGTTRYCSKCGENYGMPHGVFNYCPNCGAKMGEENKKECEK